jgi:hypothetical protein
MASMIVLASAKGRVKRPIAIRKPPKNCRPARSGDQSHPGWNPMFSTKPTWARGWLIFTHPSTTSMPPTAILMAAHAKGSAKRS